MAGTKYRPKNKPKPKAKPANKTSTNGGGFLPANAKYVKQRADHGRDLITDAGGPIIAPGNGYVIRVGNDPSGFGPSYPIIHFTSGPYAGRDMYIGHTYSALSAGATFSTGQVLAYTGTSGVGSAKTPGWAEIGYGIPGTSSYKYGQPPFGGSDSPGSGGPVSTAPTTAAPTSSVPGDSTPNSPPITSSPVYALPNDPGIPQPPMPELPGSAYIAPDNPAAAWRQIAAQSLSSPEAQRWASLMGGNA